MNTLNRWATQIAYGIFGVSLYFLFKLIVTGRFGPG